MTDEEKTREQLLDELRELRGQLKQVDGHRQTEEGLCLQIDRLPLAYLRLDADMRVREWNAAAVKIFGYTTEEACGQVCLDLILPLPLNDQVQQVVRRIRAGDMHAHSVNENRTKDGRTITCEWFNTPLMDPGGRFTGVISLAQDITERKQAGEALAKYAAGLQALSRRLVEVQEEERRYLARELHDEIGQILTSLKLALDASAAAPPETARLTLDEVRALIEETLTRVRELSFDLRPALLDHFGLLPALRWLIERYAACSRIRVNFTHSGLDGRLMPELETAAYRMVQEALTNVARHAQVQETAVCLWMDADTLQVQVEDAGVGFDPDAVLAAGRSHGLTGMQERVRLLGGRLLIESAPGSGTHLLAEFPLHGHTGAKILEHFQRLSR